MILEKTAKIGIGTMGIGGYFTRDTSHDAFHIQVLRKSIDAGMTFIDTAELYGEGHAEELIAEMITVQDVDGIRDKVFIASKVAPEHLRYDDVIKSAEGSLRRLRTQYIDLYQIHWPNPAVNVRETLSAMRYLMGVGKVKHVGVCNFSLRELKIAKELANEMGFDIVSNQVEYNLFNRTIEDDLLPYCQKNDITVIAYSPLDKGNLKKYKELEPIARTYNKTVAQLILAWIVSHNNVMAIVKSEYHIADNASADFELRKEDIEFINNTYKTTVLEIPANKILVCSDGLNKYIPRIPQLAQSILEGTILKPIRVQHIGKGNGIYKLIEGKARYWAHVHALGKKAVIRALVGD